MKLQKEKTALDGRGKHRNHARGKKHPRWNPKIATSKGYILIRVNKNDILSDSNGYATEHHIVWREAGNPHPKKGQVIHHINGNKQDNRLENLKLLTRRQHAVEHGYHTLEDKDIIAIRERFSNGEMMKTLAKEYSVPHQRISRIVRGIVYADIGGTISLRDNRKKCKETGRFVGKKAAGSFLDDMEYKEMPEDVITHR